MEFGESEDTVLVDTHALNGV